MPLFSADRIHADLSAVLLPAAIVFAYLSAVYSSLRKASAFLCSVSGFPVFQNAESEFLAVLPMKSDYWHYYIHSAVIHTALQTRM